VLRISDSPWNWANATKYTVETVDGGWGSLRFTYPRFVDKNANSNDVIDAEEFYIVGNNPNGNYGGDQYMLSARRLCIEVAGNICNPK